MIDTKISIHVDYEFIGETNCEWHSFQQHVQDMLENFVLHTVPTTYTKIGSVCMVKELPNIWTNVWVRYDKDDCKIKVICVDYKVDVESPTELLKKADSNV